MDEDAFHRLLDADPDNSGARFVFADWLEEKGDRRAAGMRWLGGNGKRPTADDKRYSSWTSEKNSPTYDGGLSAIPHRYCKLLKGHCEVKGPVHWGFFSRREAEDSFCLAFAALADAEAELSAAEAEMYGAEKEGCEFMTYCTCIAAHERAEAGKQTQITCARCAKIRTLQKRIKKLEVSVRR